MKLLYDPVAEVLQDFNNMLEVMRADFRKQFGDSAITSAFEALQPEVVASPGWHNRPEFAKSLSGTMAIHQLMFGTSYMAICFRSVDGCDFFATTIVGKDNSDIVAMGYDRLPTPVPKEDAVWTTYQYHPIDRMKLLAAMLTYVSSPKLFP